MPPSIIPKGAVIVSCQARPDNPLHGPVFMAAMAMAAAQGGAGGIRANGAADVAAIRALVDLPIIGILKRAGASPDHVEITPALADASVIVAAGADVVALDGTARPRDGEGLGDLIAGVRGRLGRPVMADVDTAANGRRAAAFGADIVATTLSGYTADTRAPRDAAPDFDLIAALVGAVSVPVIAEGRLWTPEHVAEAFARGAHAVVIGTAITNPRDITRRFVGAAP
jgi:putative N-acetylmannosamine-6-phosphate epimerase